MKPIPFSLRQIDYVLAVAEAGSTAAAARALNVSQPSVSLTVARAEAHFGAALFLRLPGQGMQPTPFGRHKLAELAALAAQARAVFGAGGAAALSLRLGVFSTLGPQHAPRLVRAFAGRHPGAQVTLVEDDLDGLMRGLRTGRLDLALVYDVGLPGDVALTHLRDVPPHALVPPGHRLAGRGPAALADLAGDPIVLINLPHSRGYFLSLFQIRGLSPRIAAETGSVEMLRAMVANGFGVGLLATDLPYGLTYDGQEVVRLDLAGPLPPSRIALARAAALPPSPAAAAFADLARALLAPVRASASTSGSGR